MGCVNFDDDCAYAQWLTQREQQARRLPGKLQYRLPTGDEWLKFAQCGDNRRYPWGNDLPPKYGNCAGEEGATVQGHGVLLGRYNDGFWLSCPVEKSGRNDWGLYGVGGNATECTTKTPGGAFDGWRGGCYQFSAEYQLRRRPLPHLAQGSGTMAATLGSEP